jgi:NADPH:quinone reductase-like Zn-dependent oxidoreductase
VTSGAVAGPIVNLDMRTVYLRNLAIFGTTAWDEACFPNLMEYIARNEFRPIVEKTYPLSDIADAQKDLATRKHLGKLVLVPP